MDLNHEEADFAAGTGRMFSVSGINTLSLSGGLLKL
jgi:hypothetical protein